MLVSVGLTKTFFFFFFALKETPVYHNATWGIGCFACLDLWIMMSPTNGCDALVQSCSWTVGVVQRVRGSWPFWGW